MRIKRNNWIRSSALGCLGIVVTVLFSLGSSGFYHFELYQTAGCFFMDDHLATNCEYPFLYILSDYENNQYKNIQVSSPLNIYEKFPTKTRTALRDVSSYLENTQRSEFEEKKKEVKQIVLKNILVAESWDEVVDKRVYMSSKPFSSTEVIINSWREKISFPYEKAWFFFIDDHPTTNWEHPCRYIFVDYESSQYEIIQVTSPPNVFKRIPKKTRILLEEVTRRVE